VDIAVITQLYLYSTCLVYQLHVSAIVNSAIIRMDTIVRETIQYNVIQYNLQCQGKYGEGGEISFTAGFWGMCVNGNTIYYIYSIIYI
jgi:hypothetical protein